MATGVPPEPVEVELVAAESRLRIQWDDEHDSSYPLRYLRGFCPCAVCQGHGGGWEYVPIDSPKLTAISEMGNYALKIDWNDGEGGPHNTGIYSFEILRELCPCPICQKQRGQQHPMQRMPADAVSARSASQ